MLCCAWWLTTQQHQASGEARLLQAALQKHANSMLTAQFMDSCIEACALDELCAIDKLVVVLFDQTHCGCSTGHVIPCVFFAACSLSALDM
jgi:hypothetical protein